MLPEAASEHGAAIDMLMDANLALIIFVFAITHIILLYFVFRYAKTKNAVATYKTHDNKLELIWTAVPATVLAVIIIFGIATWNSAMRETPEDAINIELYARHPIEHGNKRGSLWYTRCSVYRACNCPLLGGQKIQTHYFLNAQYSFAK